MPPCLLTNKAALEILSEKSSPKLGEKDKQEMCGEKDNHGFIMQAGPSLSQQGSASLFLQGL